MIEKEQDYISARKKDIYKNLYRLQRQVRHLLEHNAPSEVVEPYLRALRKAERNIEQVRRRATKAKEAQKKEPHA